MKPLGTDRFAPFQRRMAAEGLPEIAIRTFRFYFDQLVDGGTGLVPAAGLQPVHDLPDAEALPPAMADAGRAALSRTVLIKLNGGLGTGMGLEKAKTLLRIRGELTFLDIIARQALASRIPLVLMNSFNTRDDSLALLRRYPALRGGVPLDFLQHKVPKVLQADLTPAVWPANPSLEWCPPGHGDIFTSLATSGMLDRLLEDGYRTAFVSNADNLGAVLDPGILGHFVSAGLPFMMEVTDRTEADRKGGPLVRTSSGRYLLWESALVPPEDSQSFNDIGRHRYFNTNNLWLDLEALKDKLASGQGVLGLPMICSSKHLDPRDASSPLVYQLETAMGAAVGAFSGAEAIRVPRTRFAPVKTTDDLLAVRSDCYVLTEDYRVVPNPARQEGTPLVSLDPTFYRMIDQLEERFPFGPPSLLGCRRLRLTGDIRFGRAVTLRGDLHLVNNEAEPLAIPDGTLLVKE